MSRDISPLAQAESACTENAFQMDLMILWNRASKQGEAVGGRKEKATETQIGRADLGQWFTFSQRWTRADSGRETPAMH